MSEKLVKHILASLLGSYVETEMSGRYGLNGTLSQNEDGRFVVTSKVGAVRSFTCHDVAWVKVYQFAEPTIFLVYSDTEPKESTIGRVS